MTIVVLKPTLMCNVAKITGNHTDSKRHVFEKRQHEQAQIITTIIISLVLAKHVHIYAIISTVVPKRTHMYSYTHVYVWARKNSHSVSRTHGVTVVELRRVTKRA